MLNTATGLPTNNTSKKEGRVRKFDSVISLMNDNMIQGVSSGEDMSDGIDVPIIFKILKDKLLIEAEEMPDRVPDFSILHEVVKRFPNAMRMADENGDSPLHFAVKSKINYGAVHAMLKHFIENKMSEELQTVLTQRDGEGRMPFHAAIENELDAKTLISLIDADNQVLCHMSLTSSTPFQSLLRHCSLQYIRQVFSGVMSCPHIEMSIVKKIFGSGNLHKDTLMHQDSSRSATPPDY